MKKRQRKKNFKKLLACDEFWASFALGVPIAWETPDPFLLRLLKRYPPGQP